jgi:hypothetical protein
MIFQILDVDCYHGYKRGERPKAFVLNNNKYLINEIVDRWYEGSIEAQRPILNYFKVLTTEGNIFLLRYNPKYDSWAIQVE